MKGESVIVNRVWKRNYRKFTASKLPLGGGVGGEAWEYYINLTRHTTYNQNPATLLPQTIIGPFVELLAFDGKSFGLKWWAYY